MIYNAGTIFVSGNTAAGPGANFTAPANQVRAGQTLITLSSPVQIFQIVSVDSATQLTITPAATPAENQKYAILVSDAMSVDGLAQAMSQLIQEYDGNISAWEAFALTTVPQDITVTINGINLSIPSLNKIATTLGNKADLVDGVIPFRQLGLGNNGVVRGAGTDDWIGIDLATFVAKCAAEPSLAGSSYISGNWVSFLSIRHRNGLGSDARSYGFTIEDLSMVTSTIPNNFFIRKQTGSTYSAARILTSANTTTDSNGFIKAASPVVNIYADRCETNDECEGVTVMRQAEGVYLVDGCMGLNSDAAWGGPDGGFEIPTDRNKLALIWLDYKVLADGSVLVKTYHRTHPDAPEFARNEREGYASGDPIDIPAGQFVSVRVEMPDSSIYNQKLNAAVEK